MRTRSRLGVLAGFAMPIGLALGVAAPAALADGQGTSKVVQSNWYWYHQADAASGTGLEALPEPSGVPKGDLSVAYTGGTTTDQTQPSKETFLAFDLSGISPLASVSSFSFTLTLDGAAQLKGPPPALIACAPVRTWTNGEGTGWADKPAEECSPAIAAAGKPDATGGTYTFTIPSMAQNWISDVNTGVAIRQDPTNQKAPFQLNFKGPSTVTAKLVYLPPMSTPSAPPVTTQATPVVPNSGSATGALGGMSSLGAPSGTGGAPPTVAPAPSPAPQVAPQPPLAAVEHFAPASSMPSTSFWLVALAMLGFLVLVSLVLGDTTTPLPAGPSAKPRRVSRLDQVLRARRTSFTLEPR